MRIWYFVLSLILSSGLAHAQGFTLQELRQAVITRDFGALNEGLDAAQAEFLAGQRSADDMRALYIALSRSAPEVITGVEAWLAADPENPKAQIARAWSLHNQAHYRGWGQNYYSEHAKQTMMTEVYKLVVAAYLQDPDLIPASDAVIRNLGLNNLDIHSPLEAFDRLSKTNPNWGSVERIIPDVNYFAGPLMIKFCRGVADDFPPEEQDVINHRCILAAAHQSRSDHLKTHALEMLWDHDHPDSIYEQILFLIGTKPFENWTAEEISWAKEQLLVYPADPFELVILDQMAKRLSFIARTAHGQADPFFERFRLARLELAETYLAVDPNNLELLRMVEAARFGQVIDYYTNDAGEQRYRLTSPKLSEAERQARDEMRHDFSQRRVQTAPYYAEFWKSYALRARHQNGLYTLFDGDKAMQNFLAYSSDPAAALRTWIEMKRGDHDMYLRALSIPEEDLQRLPNWQSFLSGTDLDQDIHCPYLRARELHRRFCEHYPEGAAQCVPFEGVEHLKHEELYASASTAQACIGLLELDTEDLWYKPLNFSEATGKL